MKFILLKSIPLILAIQPFIGIKYFAYADPAPLIIRLNKAQSDADTTQAYYAGLIHLALEKAKKTNNYTIEYTKMTLSQGRIISELKKKKGLINIFQTGTSIEREKNLRAIRIPLLKGILGYRVNIIHKENIPLLDSINELKDLSKLIACQGIHWPDSDILESAHLRILRNTSFNSMFLQTKYKRCDYFPRSIVEAYSEVSAYKDPDLVVYDKFIIKYDFPMYFFVSPFEEQLAKDIETGLNIALNDGSFDEYFKNSSISKHLFPIEKWKQVRKFNIENKLLPKDTPVSDKKLWLRF